jgi:hypothetical protein
MKTPPRAAAAVLDARHHRAPCARDARQLAFAHAVQQGVLRMHVDERFRHVIRQPGGLAGVGHRVPLVAYAPGVEHHRILGAGRVRRCARDSGNEARPAIRMGETAVAEQVRGACQPAFVIAHHRPLDRLQIVVLTLAQAGQRGELERTCACTFIAMAAQARVLVEDVVHAGVVETGKPHALGDLAQRLPVGAGGPAGDTRRTPERLYRVAMRRIVEGHVRSQHVGQPPPHFAAVHRVRLAENGPMPGWPIDRAALLPRRYKNPLRYIARLQIAVDDDQVGPQLG